MRIAPVRSQIADLLVLWRMGALFSASRKFRGEARRAFLLTRVGLVGRCGRHRISLVGLRAYGEGCTQLTSLDLWDCKQITDASVIALSKGCPNLTSLDLSECEDITDASVIALSKGCPNLHLSRGEDSI